MKLSVTAIAVVVVLAVAGAAHAHGHPTGDRAGEDRARGLVYRGLAPAHGGGPCRAGFELVRANGAVDCTHGPDPAPRGRDVRRPRSLTELAASTGSTDSSGDSGDGSIVCTEDGVSGNRVQAIYAYPAAGADNYDEIAPYIRRWAGIVDRVVNESAAETGGVRHVRFVTDSGCALDVAKVALSDDGIASFAGTVDELAAQGFDRSDRKYLVWVDAYVYCGIAMIRSDDRASQDNRNNGSGPAMVGRTDRGCWGSAAASVETHELVHVLGGVQLSAPNATDGFHCADEAELVCYDDYGARDGYVSVNGDVTPLRSVCPSSHERLLDCNNDDYFHTAPPAATYLATHWNVANSSFLTAEGPAIVSDTTAPRATAPKPTIVGRLRARAQVKVRWSSPDADVAGYWLWKSVDGGAWSFVPVPNPAATTAVLSLARGHSYRFLVHAYDTAGNASPAAVGPLFALRVVEERSSAISYRGAWRRQYRSYASARYHAAGERRRAEARFAFTGRAVAWVSRTDPSGGRARVYVDGRLAAHVSLYAPAATARKVVFAKRWSSSRSHRVTIVVTRAGKRAPVPVDAFVVLR